MQLALFTHILELKLIIMKMLDYNFILYLLKFNYILNSNNPFALNMGPKKGAAGDGEDLSCEKFYAKYKKECAALGFKPSPQVVEKYNNEYLDNGSNLLKFNLWDEMGWQGVKALMDSMYAVNYQHTQSIRLWSTMCEDEGCRAICRYISICPSVIVLELLQNNITALGCQFIGKTINPMNT